MKVANLFIGSTDFVLESRNEILSYNYDMTSSMFDIIISRVQYQVEIS